MRSSSEPIRRGVNARDTSVRRRVWSGGSRKIIIPLGMRFADIISRTVPWLEQ